MSAVIVLIDGEHHPAAVRAALDEVAADRPIVGVVFCGGEEKVGRGVLERPEEHYGRPVESGDPEDSLRRLADDARVVLDLADEPVLPAARKLRLASLGLHLGLDFESPGLRLTPPPFEPVPFDGPLLAVIGTGKRTGKTAVAGHWAGILPGAAVVSMGRGGPPEPELVSADVTLADLERLAAQGRHAASDHFEHAVLAGVPAVGCRRVGGGLAGEPFVSNVREGAELAASLGPDTIVFDGSGATLPPVRVHRTVCVIRDRAPTLGELGPYRLLRSQLVLQFSDDDELTHEAAAIADCPVLRCAFRAEPAEPLDPDARVALFTTRGSGVEGLEPVVSSTNLAQRSALEDDLAAAEREGCDVYLTELKAAAIDTVAARARERGTRVVLLRNRPVGVGVDLDAALVTLYESARDER